MIVDYSEIFDHADSRFGIEWDRCLEIFHEGRIILSEEGKNVEFSVEDLERTLRENEEAESYKILGYKILLDFMKENDLNEIYVENDQ